MPNHRPYHHGNLREALVEAAVALIEESGPQGFTLAEAARRAGVSAAAPYRHFKGRDDLLEEIAKRGFEEFGSAMWDAWDDGLPNPLAAFSRLGQCYLDFARERPAYYIAMFESGVALAPNTELWELSEHGFGVLLAAAEALSRPLPRDKRPPPRMFANHIWAMSHGVVELFGRGAPGARSPISPEDMLSSAALVYLRGLGLIGQ
ncbi:TetR/AcrR family transcriptional regulator [Paracoccus aurantiacus]|uniref:TetR/AcrR family transcriptional regulator n=1 Tax=Paracoccus aurantiacus TaxID=2599412 RepID=A0A5C6S2X5_9RHOB|nr:TetR/AcrR family transcriptional regulator [Paracoccus aurantiacus]TXB68980.1 TetR/AcrR family transcriptional regulator [Paracoccus aurantiacus]